jgi:hypothetical protein
MTISLVFFGRFFWGLLEGASTGILFSFRRLITLNPIKPEEPNTIEESLFIYTI